MRQFEDWRFTKGATEPPQAYLDYLLCAQIYHCTPAELDEQDALTVNLHLEFWAKEQERAHGKKRRYLNNRKRNRGKQQHAGNHHQGERPGVEDLIRDFG